MGNQGFAAVLFYAQGSDIVMRAGGTMAPGRNTKILWWVKGAGNDPLVIHGRESASGRRFTQRVESIGGGQYPSIVVVPAKGCWTLDETVSGRYVGTISIPVESAIAAS
jgi:hypothetical protein